MSDSTDAKSEALRAHRALHARPEDVTDELFLTDEFFDPHDLVQVKYEMLRRVQVDHLSVSQAANTLWVLAAFFLPEPGCFPASGTSRTDPSASRAENGAQAFGRGAGVHRAAASVGRGPAGTGIVGANLEEVRPLGASPEHRTGLVATAKKGAIDPAADSFGLSLRAGPAVDGTLRTVAPTSRGGGVWRAWLGTDTLSATRAGGLDAGLATNVVTETATRTSHARGTRGEDAFVYRAA